MYAPLIVAYTLLLIGPPGLTSGQHPVSEQGQTLVFIMSVVAALALGIILGRWIYQPSTKEPADDNAKV